MAQSPLVPHVRLNTPNPKPATRRSSEDTTPLWKKRLEYVAALIGLSLLVVNIVQMRATQQAADAAKRAVEISAVAIEEEQRPWLVPRFTVRKPLSLEGSTAKITVVLNINNTGHSPATETHHITHLSPGKLKWESDEDVSARMNMLSRSECGEEMKPWNPFTVFPNDPYESIPMNLSYDLTQHKKNGPQSFYFILSTCIDYEIPVSHRHRQTTYFGFVNGNPDPMPSVFFDASGKFTLKDNAQGYEIVKFGEVAN